MNALASIFAAFGILLTEGKPVENFEVEGANIHLIHAEKIKNSTLSSCEEKLQKIQNYQPGEILGIPEQRELKLSQAWNPWGEKEETSVLECEEFPCQVKLSKSEVERLKKVDKKKRKSEFEAIVLDRVSRYVKTGHRTEYEFPGDPVDPWAWLKKKGMTTPLELAKTAPSLQARKLIFSKEYRPIRQVLDVRTLLTKDRVSVLVRDAYTAHYFDGWGEWVEAVCEESGEMIIVQSLFLELDLLKKTDFFSKLNRGKMKREVEKNAKSYLQEMRVVLSVNP